MANQHPDIRVWDYDGLDKVHLSPTQQKGTSASGRIRSSSVTPSEASRITLVEDNVDLVEPPADRRKTSDEVISPEPPCRWIDHFLGVLCIPRRPERAKARPSRELKVVAPEAPWGSPWILPVMVHSARRDTNRIPVHQQAQCTIDTANLQGNIVSRDFLLNVLEYPESEIRSLKDAELTPGLSITGHEHHAEGAIYLTWYHKNSTRVFHNMRFLISKHPHFDLIIGARSIQSNNLLSVPMLMNSPGDVYLIPDHVREPKKLENARNERTKCHGKMQRLSASIREAEREGNTRAMSKLQTEKTLITAKYEVARLQVDLWTNAKPELEPQIKADLTAAEEEVGNLTGSGSAPLPRGPVVKDTASASGSTRSVVASPPKGVPKTAEVKKRQGSKKGLK